jgi:hypothetical protein
MLSTLSGFHGSLGRFRRRPTLRGALACSCLVGGPVKADRVTKAVPGLEFGSQEKVVEGQLPDTVRLKHPQATEVWIDCPPGAGGNPVINAKNALPPSGYFDLIGQVVSVAIKTHSTKPAKLQLTARSRRSLREMSLSTSKATVSGLSAAPTVGAAKPLCTSLSTRGLLWSAATPSPACGDGPEPYDKRGFGAPLRVVSTIFVVALMARLLKGNLGCFSPELEVRFFRRPRVACFGVHFCSVEART